MAEIWSFLLLVQRNSTMGPEEVISLLFKTVLLNARYIDQHFDIKVSIFYVLTNRDVFHIALHSSEFLKSRATKVTSSSHKDENRKVLLG